MTHLDIYTADYEPRHVYGDGRDPSLVESAVRFGDAPLDLLVTFDDPGGRVVWTFKGKRGSEASRTEYYLADYRTGREDLFRLLAEELAGAHDDGWIVPHAGDLRWDLGFELWRVPAEMPDLTPGARERLFDRLADDGSGEDPLSFGMTDHRSALSVVRAIQESDTDCTVAVGAEGDPSSLDGVDLLLRPGGETDFEPGSPAAEQVLDPQGTDRNPTAAGEPTTVEDSTGTAPDATASDTTDLIRTDADPTERPDRTGDASDRTDDDPTGGPERARDASGSAGPEVEVDELGFASRIAGVALLVMLVFAGVSFVSRRPVHPITGLAAIGGALGTIVSLIAVGHRLGPDGDGSLLLAAMPVLAAREGASRDMTVTAVAYGTFSAFLFPSVFRVGGRHVTDGNWLLDPASTLPGAALQVPLFVGALYLASVGLLGLARVRVGQPPWTPETLRELVVAHLVYGLAVLLATGLANLFWYSAIPATA